MLVKLSPDKMAFWRVMGAGLGLELNHAAQDAYTGSSGGGLAGRSENHVCSLDKQFTSQAE